MMVGSLPFLRLAFQPFAVSAVFGQILVDGLRGVVAVIFKVISTIIFAKVVLIVFRIFLTITAAGFATGVGVLFGFCHVLQANEFRAI